jgi:hypothetical protein
METILVSKSSTLVDGDSSKNYVDVLNGIVWDCSHGGFRSGYRNQVAVDLTVAAHMLGFDPNDVIDWLTKDCIVIDPSDDDEDTFDRIERIKGYSDSFSWEWMINPEYYQAIGFDTYTRDMPIRFELC